MSRVASDIAPRVFQPPLVRKDVPVREGYLAVYLHDLKLSLVFSLDSFPRKQYLATEINGHSRTFPPSPTEIGNIW